MTFNPLNYPAIFMPPKYLNAHSTWMGHIPFAFLLTSLARPRTIVELGTHTGVSYFAFCQAVVQLKLGTQCHAVDTWQGDSQAGEYGQGVLNQVRAVHDPLYSGFSTLVQSTFDEAASRLPDGSIDLLHIDGLHTYEAVRHDYEHWLPKLSDAAVVIMHDTFVQDEGYGVNKFWSEIRGRFPSFEFNHSCGLGILAVGKNTPAPVRQFIADAAQNPDAVRAFFSVLGKNVIDSFYLQAVGQCLYDPQTELNRYLRSRGIAFESQSRVLLEALNNVANYVKAVNGEVKRLVKENQKLR